jgi:hypothetical protein
MALACQSKELRVSNPLAGGACPSNEFETRNSFEGHAQILRGLRVKKFQINARAKYRRKRQSVAS